MEPTEYEKLRDRVANGDTLTQDEVFSVFRHADEIEGRMMAAETSLTEQEKQVLTLTETLSAVRAELEAAKEPSLRDEYQQQDDDLAKRVERLEGELAAFSYATGRNR